VLGIGTVDTVVSGGWFPNQRIRTKKDVHDERVRLGILPDEEKETLLAQTIVVPVPNKKPRIFTFEQLLGKREAASMSIDEVDEAIRRIRLQKRRKQNDEMVLLMD
jgi:hypothetical protein